MLCFRTTNYSKHHGSNGILAVTNCRPLDLNLFHFTEWPSGVWCHGLTICLLNVNLSFWKNSCMWLLVCGFGKVGNVFGTFVSFIDFIHGDIHICIRNYYCGCWYVIIMTYFGNMMTSSNDTFSALLALCVENSSVTSEFPHKGQWRGAFMFSLICAWINGWIINREAGDLRRHRFYNTPKVKCKI